MTTPYALDNDFGFIAATTGMDDAAAAAAPCRADNNNNNNKAGRRHGRGNDTNNSSNKGRSGWCATVVGQDVCGTFRCTPSTFSLLDGVSTGGDSSSMMMVVVDVPRSFSPLGWSVVLWKLVVVGGVEIAALSLGLVGDVRRPFYLAYVTHWALIASMAYSVLSLVNTLRPVTQPLTPTPPTPTLRVKSTWVLGTVALHSQFMVTVMYWTLLYEGGPVEPVTVFTHGLVAVVVWIDGLVVNRLPIRLRHWLEWLTPFYTLYLIWTILQSSVGFAIGNPDNTDGDPETNDDAIYSILVWGEDTTGAIVLTAILLLVAAPIVHIILWGSSRCGRRLVDEDNDGGHGGGGGLVEGSRSKNVNVQMSNMRDGSSTAGSNV